MCWVVVVKVHAPVYCLFERSQSLCGCFSFMCICLYLSRLKHKIEQILNLRLKR